MFLQVRILSNVDFPAPLDPITARHDPGSANPETERNTKVIFSKIKSDIKIVRQGFSYNQKNNIHNSHISFCRVAA